MGTSSRSWRLTSAGSGGPSPATPPAEGAAPAGGRPPARPEAPMSHGPFVGVLQDADHLVLRRALRITVAMTVVFALADLVLDNSSVALFASFSSFAIVVFTDFGGPTKRRLLGTA